MFLPSGEMSERVVWILHHRCSHSGPEFDTWGGEPWIGQRVASRRSVSLSPTPFPSLSSLSLILSLFRSSHSVPSPDLSLSSSLFISTVSLQNKSHDLSIIRLIFAMRLKIFLLLLLISPLLTALSARNEDGKYGGSFHYLTITHYLLFLLLINICLIDFFPLVYARISALIEVLMQRVTKESS